MFPVSFLPVLSPSKAWKIKPEIFQALEKLAEHFPSLGKSALDSDFQWGKQENRNGVCFAPSDVGGAFQPCEPAPPRNLHP